MNLRRKMVAGAAAAGLAITGVAAAPAANAARGEAPLADILLADGGKLDKNPNDYDIVAKAAATVLAAKPSSAVSVLTDGSVKLTAFIPNDQAFRILVEDLTGDHVRSERKVFQAVKSLGVDTVEAVLLYHVVPGKPINSKTALQADGAKLTTAQGGVIKVRVNPDKPSIVLADRDKDSRNPRVILSQVDINKKNKQLAHGIDRVLRPVDL